MIIVLLFTIRSKKINGSCDYNVLAYSSFVGPGSVGEDLKRKFDSLSECRMILTNGGSSSELEAKIYMQPKRYDVVLGLQYDTELTSKIKWYNESKILFARSPMIILTKNKGGDLVIVPDAEKSEVGKNFIKENVESKKVIKLKVKRVSSWTNGLSLFNQLEDISFYTFAGSLYYFNEDSRDENHYSFDSEVVAHYKEFFRFINESEQNDFFIKSILSPEIQKSIWSKNFMFPVDKSFYPKSLVKFIKEFSFE